MSLRPVVLLAVAFSVAALASGSATAQTPDPAPPPTDPVEQQSNEVVHSWALTPGGNDASGGVSNRSSLSYVGDPGSVIPDTVTLYNLSNVPLTFEVYATDAFNNSTGDVALLAGDETPTDVGTWVAIPNRSVPVPAGTQVTIPITITIPEGARPGDHAGAILAANAATNPTPEGGQITLDRRTGTRLDVRVNGPIISELAIADIQTDHDGSLNPLSGTTTVQYILENRGNVRLSGTARVTVSGPVGIGERRSLEKQIDDLLPGQSLTVEEVFDGVPTLGVVATKVQIEPSTGDADAFEPASRNALTLALPIGVLLGLLALLFAWLAVRAYRRHSDRVAVVPEIVAVADISTLTESEHQPT